jgi:hypothetical protein
MGTWKQVFPKRGLVWALAAAAGLLPALPAAAQMQYTPAGSTAYNAGPAMHFPGEAGLETPGVQQDDVRVQLAWLADPMTFPWNLAARIGPSSLEVVGYVPTDAVRQRVIQVARESCSLPVADRLQIHPGLPLPFASQEVSPGLRQLVLDYLAQLLGERLRYLHVQPDANGRVVLTGTVLSPQEQLQVARSLRTLNGCRAVAYRNQMPHGLVGNTMLGADRMGGAGFESVGMVEWGAAPPVPGTATGEPPLLHR